MAGRKGVFFETNRIHCLPTGLSQNVLRSDDDEDEDNAEYDEDPSDDD